MTLIFFFIILFSYDFKDVCKKPDLKILKIGYFMAFQSIGEIPPDIFRGYDIRKFKYR